MSRLFVSKISRKERKGYAKSAKQDAALSVLCETLALFAGNNLSQGRKARLYIIQKPCFLSELPLSKY